MCVLLFGFFFFKQKTAYEMRISDWSSDVCSSDLVAEGEIDATILDVNLRGGERCWPIADALAEAGIPFVLASGGDADSITDAHRDRPLLSKPFTMDAVSKVLAAL